MKTGRLPSSVRRFVHSKPWSRAAGVSNKSAFSGCSPLRWMIASRITVGALASAGVVEVDHEAYPSTRDPHADPRAVVFRVHHVHVMAAVVRLLALEEEVRTEHGGIRIARPTAEILGPDIARVAGGAESIAGVAADEVAALVVHREALRVR